jgi:hypothetical protein
LVINKKVDRVVLAEAKFRKELSCPLGTVGHCICGNILVLSFHGGECDDWLFLGNPFNCTTSEENDTARDGLFVEGFAIVRVQK